MATITAPGTGEKAKPYPLTKVILKLIYVMGLRGKTDFNSTAILIRRSIFITESGHMGMGSPNLQTGNAICLLFWGRGNFVHSKTTVVIIPLCSLQEDLERRCKESRIECV